MTVAAAIRAFSFVFPSFDALGSPRTFKILRLSISLVVSFI